LQAEALDAEGVDEVEVGVEDDWDLRLLAHRPENFHDTRRGRARFERALGRKLVDDAVGEGSEKGTPNSTMSAPARSSAQTRRASLPARDHPP